MRFNLVPSHGHRDSGQRQGKDLPQESRQLICPGSVHTQGVHAGGGLMVGGGVGVGDGVGVGIGVLLGVEVDVGIGPEAGVPLGTLPPDWHSGTPLGLTRHHRPPKLFRLLPLVSPGSLSPRYE
jgi:hypothetical protein